MYPISPKSSKFLKCGNTVIGGGMLYWKTIKVAWCWYFDEKLNISYFSAREFLRNKYKCSRVSRSTKGWETPLYSGFSRREYNPPYWWVMRHPVCSNSLVIRYFLMVSGADIVVFREIYSGCQSTYELEIAWNLIVKICIGALLP